MEYLGCVQWTDGVAEPGGAVIFGSSGDASTRGVFCAAGRVGGRGVGCRTRTASLCMAM